MIFHEILSQAPRPERPAGWLNPFAGFFAKTLGETKCWSVTWSTTVAACGGWRRWALLETHLVKHSFGHSLSQLATFLLVQQLQAFGKFAIQILNFVATVDFGNDAP